LLAPCIHSNKFHIMAISTTIGLLPLLSACASPTHGTLVEHHSTSPYRSTGTGASVHVRLMPDFAIFIGLRNNDDETMDRPLSLLVRWGPPQGMITLRIDRTNGRNVVEDTAARGAAQGGAGRTRKHTTINRGTCTLTHTTIMASSTRSRREGEWRRMDSTGRTPSPSPLRSPFAPSTSPSLGRRAEQCSNLRRRHPPQQCWRPPVLVAGIFIYSVGQLKNVFSNFSNHREGRTMNTTIKRGRGIPFGICGMNKPNNQSAGRRRGVKWVRPSGDHRGILPRRSSGNTSTSAAKHNNQLDDNRTQTTIQIRSHRLRSEQSTGE
jgi:hypothetical protein